MSLPLSQSSSVAGIQPERILDDPQAYLATKRHQRLRMELPAADRERLVLDRHGDAVFGRRGDGEHIGHAVALDKERVVAADHDLVRQVLPHASATDRAVRSTSGA